ncbi:FtsH protease activity modulator HflK [Lacrimispora indolis]|uniref:FtsH protease activity modulator HflK n=1 Tax=Lacrimispora indolis TaxID=69825 RepID=UPI00041A138C|nr:MULTISPECIES: FtsH protease activity modulator HflK [Lachnospiraceae]
MDKRFGGQEDSSNRKPENFEKLPRKKQIKMILRGIYLMIGVVLAAFLFSNSFYTLTEDKVAVVCTFGTPVSVTKTGPHFKIPFIQTVYKMSKEIKGMRIGYDEENQSTISESEMITKDFNFVNVDFYIEYQVVDPVRAYIYRDNAVDILKNLSQSYIRDTVGIYNVDEVITTGKAEIQAKVKQLLSERLEKEDIGIGINNVTIQDSEPPTKEVSNAFKAVEDAKQSMDTKINEAKKYQSEQLPAANARADKAKKDAEAYKQQRISEAEGQVSRFNDMYEEYIKYPLITKKRMFYETMENILPSLKVIIDGSDETQKVLPLEPFVSSEKGEEE